MLAVLVFIGILFCAMLGTPLFVVMSLAALSLFTMAGVEVSAVAVEVYRISSAPTLITIPLFTFAGYMMAESGAPKRLLKFAEAAFGWLPGGVAIVSLVVCAFFTAFTGASGVTIIALGGLLYPILEKEGYKEKFSLGLITSSGSLGLLFAPSLPIILYGLVAKVDIDKLFKAGVLPGIILIIVLSLWSVINGPKTREKRHFSVMELLSSLRAGFFEVLLPFGVLLSIYGGFVTVSEAAAFTCFYVLVVECFIYKDLDFFKDIPRVILDSMSLVGGILLILCCALGLTNYLVDEEVPMKILDLMRQFLTNKYQFLFFLNIFLLIVGCLMDIFSAIVVVVPLIIPIALEFDVHPIHLAIIFLLNLEIGYITPPVGINLFISSFRFKKSVTSLYKASVPFLILSLLVLMIITYIPKLSLFWVE
ncbi:MAG: C4-dicarboxylate ABC transporter [Bdellovibrionales bacterium RIFOXYB1_FULL_37_110]|nr:MAG: C4-dicarboxylate ABC transporter [Bdellovibrionales bacterium RIFOXYA1_FULL_38_20]OFZ45483.1 MAG: C4-dicarboxylate ABC transporter [Bdellovibrionales bacterium RIFOXYC1_FULL_37_79]OFZ53581.1 MAG: C4-dicarboxylate ABC transporter [Bdellovibrionales bacterium RIFOXYB2_FULL_36_6]OFZ60630.1 MAG: C4-dicarboxylate ABC transporter [Bdellovibrionales bacterium RIFOXYB1_FULL_37_110]OFZ63454.1 MAG: C4-dicarboxylate ABC transporter [Bdellovibrionales bacterium RIFOXYD1_FULL_36_51]